MAKKDGRSPKKSEQSGVFIRGQREFRHDLFKSDVQKMKRNVSFQKNVIKIVELDHAHVVHSHNSQGKKQEFTSTVGGHFHAVEFGTDKDGTPTVKCGPAMREVYAKRPGGQRRFKEVVRWNGFDSDGRERTFTDDHTHEFQYEGSEHLSERKVKATQAKNQAAVADAVGEMRELQESHAEESAGDGDLGLEEGQE